MLKIKKSLSLHLPHFDLAPPRPMQLSPVREDNDELMQAVQADPDEHDNNWELNERPDGAELDTFWNSVEDDVRRDPDWFRFDD